MADYSAYPFVGIEVEVDHWVQKRIVFAIARAKNPQWLSWYFFAEDAGFGRGKFDIAGLNGRKFDKVNIFGGAPVAGHPYGFSFGPQIDVNKFADAGGFEAPGYKPLHLAPASLNLIDRQGIYDCVINAKVGAGAALIDFDLSHAAALLNDINLRRSGFLYLLGSVPFSKTAITAGPPDPKKTKTGRRFLDPLF